MYIKNDELVTFAAEDYIYSCMFTSDQVRIKKGDIKELVEYYFIYMTDERLINVDDLTDWIHELDDESIEMIKLERGK